MPFVDFQYHLDLINNFPRLDLSSNKMENALKIQKWVLNGMKPLVKMLMLFVLKILKMVKIVIVISSKLMMKIDTNWYLKKTAMIKKLLLLILTIISKQLMIGINALNV